MHTVSLQSVFILIFLVFVFLPLLKNIQKFKHDERVLATKPETTIFVKSTGNSWYTILFRTLKQIKITGVCIPSNEQQVKCNGFRFCNHTQANEFIFFFI